MGLTGPVVLMLLGGVFLAANFNVVDDMVKLWPLGLIAVGVAQLIDRLRK